MKFRPHHPGKAGNKHQSQRQNDAVLFPGADKADDQQRQQKTGESGQRIVEAHQDIIEKTSEIAGDSADERPDNCADGNR